MNIPGPSTASTYAYASPQTAVEGIRTQQQILERNVVEVAHNEGAQSHDNSSQDRALVEQSEIVDAVQANARSLQAASERIGTILDIEV